MSSLVLGRGVLKLTLQWKASMSDCPKLWFDHSWRFSWFELFIDDPCKPVRLRFKAIKHLQELQALQASLISLEKWEKLKSCKNCKNSLLKSRKLKVTKLLFLSCVAVSSHLSCNPTHHFLDPSVKANLARIRHCKRQAFHKVLSKYLYYTEMKSTSAKFQSRLDTLSCNL